MKVNQIHCGIILVFTLSNLFGQIKIHKHLTTEDGLISNQIICMLEDSKGYIWFGTDNGLSKWDGNNFKNYSTKDGLAYAHVADIGEGLDGTIYIANYGKGISLIKNDTITILDESNGLVSNWVTKILVRRNGDVVIAAEHGKISLIRNDEVLNWQKEIGFANNSIRTLFESEDSTLYLGSHKLYQYSNKILTEYSHSTSDNLYISSKIIYAIDKDKEGNLLVGNKKGIYKLNDKRLEEILINTNGDSFPSGAIKTSKNGKTYFCSDRGVLVKSDHIYELLTEENGLSDNSVWSILEDSHGTIYFGTRDHGVNIYHPDRMTTFLPNELSKKSVSAIYVDTLSNFYIGTTESLIMKKNTSNFTDTILRRKRINSIYPSKNKILVGTDAGLNILKSNNENNFVPFDDPGGFNNVWAITKNKNNDLLIGFQGGLFILENNQLNKINSFKGHNQFIQDILITNDSSLVIGTHGNGISIYKNGGQRTINSSNGLSDNIVNALYETNDNVLLVGTDQGGLNIIENGLVLKTIDISSGLTTNTIVDIHEDKQNNIYLSTANGINILSSWRDSVFIRTIMRKDGLVSNSCNKNATFLDNEGILWIGTSNGISKYDPSADKEITSPPKIYLTSLEIFNKPYPIKNLRVTGTLDHDQNYIKFIYEGINLSAPSKMLYKYRLNDVDQEWVKSKENNVQYTSLDDGDYTFEVKVRNEWGYWSQPTQLAFTINPAWWETWWFRLAIITALGFLLWLAFQYRLNYLLKLERLRTKIASDLHDEVGSLLTQISINVDSLSYTKDEEKRKEKSNFIRTKSSEVINMMSDVIWSIDSRNDNLECLADRIHNFAQNFLLQKDIVLNFNSEIDDLQKSLKIDFRQNVMMIAKEAINNAVKYSDCTQIDIYIKHVENKFLIMVKDNGKGIKFKNVQQGNGLKNMKMRAKLIDAEIDITNNDGCEIKLTKNKL